MAGERVRQRRLANGTRSRFGNQSQVARRGSRDGQLPDRFYHALNDRKVEYQQSAEAIARWLLSINDSDIEELKKRGNHKMQEGKV